MISIWTGVQLQIHLAVLSSRIIVGMRVLYNARFMLT